MAMAWYHSDLYHRVLSYSGKFVYQQWPYNPDTPHGACEFHETLIPSSPKKPLRLRPSLLHRQPRRSALVARFLLGI